MFKGNEHNYIGNWHDDKKHGFGFDNDGEDLLWEFINGEKARWIE